jgi:hypothetical protein
MGVQTGPGRLPPRQRPGRQARTRARTEEALVVRSMMVAVIAGLTSVLALAALGAVTGNPTTATVGITAVAALVTAATGVAAAYLRRRR